MLTNGAICESFSATFDSGPHPAFHPVSLIWDTGSVTTMISKRIVNILHLLPLGVENCVNSHGTIRVNYYLINLLIPNKIEISGLKVIADELPDTDCLVGMDVINMCDFAITHKAGKTKFSFQMPPVADIQF